MESQMFKNTFKIGDLSRPIYKWNITPFKMENYAFGTSIECKRNLRPCKTPPNQWNYNINIFILVMTHAVNDSITSFFIKKQKQLKANICCQFLVSVEMKH